MLALAKEWTVSVSHKRTAMAVLCVVMACVSGCGGQLQPATSGTSTEPLPTPQSTATIGVTPTPPPASATTSAGQSTATPAPTTAAADQATSTSLPSPTQISIQSSLSNLSL